MTTDSSLEARTSPFVREAWYAVARSADIGRDLVGTMILEEPIVLYRTLAGAPVALIDACSHRKFPLSKSYLVGDTIRCGYHGFEFNGVGRCVAIPTATSIPAGADVRSYPVEERHGYVWIWMGRAGEADTSRIVDCSHMETDSQVYRTDTIGCHYQALIENLLDFSHLPYVHASNQGHSGNAAVIPRVRTEGDVLIAERVMRGSPVPPAFQRRLGLAEGTLVDHEQVFEFHAPSVVFIKQRMWASDGAGVAYAFASNHLVTPRDRRNTHYLSTLTAEEETLAPDALAAMAIAAEVATEQDKFVLEQQDQNYWRLADQPFDAPAIANRFDRAPLLARSMIRKLGEATPSARQPESTGDVIIRAFNA